MVKAKPGDLARVVCSDDTLIKQGSLGVIEGKVSTYKTTYNVTFNPSLPWWDRGFVEASGGPTRIVKSSDLKYTGESKSQKFHYNPGLPSAGSAEVLTKKVKIFGVDLCKRRKRV